MVVKKNKLFLMILFPILIIGYLLFISLPFPNMSTSTGHVLLSYTIFIGLVIYSLYVFYKKDFYSLAFFYNFTWLFSISLALLSLSYVQYDLTIEYIYFLFLTIVFFNVGYYILNSRSYKDSFSNESKDLYPYDKFKFKLFFLIILLICLAGYAYEIHEIGFLPILAAQDEGFYDNRAGMLSIIHYFATSLGGFAGASLAFFFISKKSKIFYMLLFIVALLAAISLLAKNILFLTIFYFLAIMKYHEKLTTKFLVTFFLISASLLLLSSAVRTGSSDYIKTYSQIEYDGLPAFFYWINTYFAINVTHLNTYFTNGSTDTYGLRTIALFTSLFFLKGQAQEFIGDEIIYFNGLGGNINVVPMLYSYLTDYGIFAFVPMLFVGMLSGYINKMFKLKCSYFYAIMYGSFAYILALSVFGDFLNRLMVPINAFFLLIPYFISKVDFNLFRRIK